MVKFLVFDEDFGIRRRVSVESPRIGGGLYDARAILDIVEKFVGEASRLGISPGVSVFRASPVVFQPGGTPVESVISWLTWRERVEAASSLPVPARLASHLPVVGRVFRPESPLPLMVMLSKRYPGRHVWTLDGLIIEGLEGRFITTASNAGLSGVFNPWTLKPMRWALRLAGAPSWFRLPRVAPDRLGGSRLGAVVGDQQAAMIGSGCLSSECVKISAGTGCFADRPVGSRLIPRSGLLPIIVYDLGGERLYGIEASVPGLGLGLEWVASMLGGYQHLRVEAGACREWRGTLLLRLGGWPGHTIAYLGPGEPSLRGLACGVAVGAAVQCAAATMKLGEARDYVVTGGLTRVPLFTTVLSRLLPGSKRVCASDPAPRGAAILASQLHPREAPPPNDCFHSEGGDLGDLESIIGEALDSLRRLGMKGVPKI